MGETNLHMEIRVSVDHILLNRCIILYYICRPHRQRCRDKSFSEQRIIKDGLTEHTTLKIDLTGVSN